MKIRPVGNELFHADGQTDRYMTKLIVAFRNFANAPKHAIVWGQTRGNDKETTRKVKQNEIIKRATPIRNDSNATLRAPL
jgi:hypothetical protein